MHWYDVSNREGGADYFVSDGVGVSGGDQVVTASAGLLLFVVLIPSSAWAQDDAIRQQITKLADRDADTRAEAIEALGQTRDERVAKTLQAFNQGTLGVGTSTSLGSGTLTFATNSGNIFQAEAPRCCKAPKVPWR